jgi:hypothetical protein
MAMGSQEPRLDSAGGGVSVDARDVHFVAGKVARKGDCRFQIDDCRFQWLDHCGFKSQIWNLKSAILNPR